MLLYAVYDVLAAALRLDRGPKQRLDMVEVALSHSCMAAFEAISTNLQGVADESCQKHVHINVAESVSRRYFFIAILAQGARTALK